MLIDAHAQSEGVAFLPYSYFSRFLPASYLK